MVMKDDQRALHCDGVGLCGKKGYMIHGTKQTIATCAALSYWEGFSCRGQNESSLPYDGTVDSTKDTPGCFTLSPTESTSRSAQRG